MSRCADDGDAAGGESVSSFGLGGFVGSCWVLAWTVTMTVTTLEMSAM